MRGAGQRGHIKAEGRAGCRTLMAHTSIPQQALKSPHPASEASSSCCSLSPQKGVQHKPQPQRASLNLCGTSQMSGQGDPAQARSETRHCLCGARKATCEATGREVSWEPPKNPSSWDYFTHGFISLLLPPQRCCVSQQAQQKADRVKRTSCFLI